MTAVVVKTVIVISLSVTVTMANSSDSDVDVDTGSDSDSDSVSDSDSDSDSDNNSDSRLSCSDVPWSLNYVNFVHQAFYQTSNFTFQTITFTDRFFSPPVVLVTPKHSHTNNYSHLSQCNAVTAWAEVGCLRISFYYPLMARMSFFKFL